MIFSVALFGLGNVGFKYDKNVKNKSYLTHYSTIKNLDGFELIYAIDNDKKNRVEFEKITKIKTISTDELLKENKKIEIVIIATPPKTHIDIIKKVVVLSTDKAAYPINATRTHPGMLRPRSCH